MLRRQAIAAWRPCCSKLLPCVLQWVQTWSIPWPMLCSKGSKKVEQLRSRCQEEMKEEGIAKMNKSKVEPVSSGVAPPGGLIQGAPASSLEVDLPPVRRAPGEGGRALRSGTRGVRERGPSRSPGRHSIDEEGDADVVP